MNDAVDINVNIVPSESSLTQTRDAINDMLTSAFILKGNAKQPEFIEQLMQDIGKVINETYTLEKRLSSISHTSLDFELDKTLAELGEVEARMIEIEEFSKKGSGEAINSATQEFNSAEANLINYNTQLEKAVQLQEELAEKIQTATGSERKKAQTAYTQNAQVIKNLQMQIQAAEATKRSAEETKAAVKSRLETEKSEYAELQKQQAALQDRSSVLEEIANDEEKVSAFEEKRSEIESSIGGQLQDHKTALAEYLSILQRVVSEESKRQGINVNTGEAASRLSKEEEKSLRDRRAYIKGVSAQYYYQLRALKMVSHAMDTMNKTTDKWGKSLFSTIGKITKGMLKLGTGFFLLRKNMDKTTTGHKSFLSSIKSGIWSILKYGLGIRSLYFLFRKLRSAIADGMETLATQFAHVNRQMSSLTTSFYMMKNASAAMVQPLLNVLAPLLERLAALFNRLAVAIASFFAALTGQSFIYKANRATQSFIDGQKGAKKATDDTNKSLKQQLASFDKLNLLTTDKDKEKDGGGGGGGVGDAFDTVPIEEKWKDLADKIKRIAKDLFYPIKMAWMQEGQFVIDSWKYGLSEIWKLIKDIGRDFLIMWQQDATVNLWRDIFHIIGDIGLIVGNLSLRLRDAWNTNHIGLKIFEEIRDIIAIIIHGIREAADYTVKWSKSLTFYPLLKSIHDLLVKIKPLIQTITDLCVYLWEKVILKFNKYLIEQGLPLLLDTLGKIIDKIDKAKLSERMKKLMDAFEPFLEKVFKALVIVIGDLGDAVAKFINSDGFGKFVDYLVKLMKQAKPETMAKAMEKLVGTFFGLKAALIGLQKVVGVLTVFKTFGNLIIQSRLRKELSLINAALTGTSTATASLGTKFTAVFTSMPTKLADIRLGLKGIADSILNIASGKATLSATVTNLVAPLQSMLGILGRCVVGVGSLVGEFSLVSSGMKNIILGAENMGASVGKVIAGLTLGAAGLVVALGPQGAVVAGLAAIVAGLHGLNKAIADTQEQIVGLSFEKALSNSDGVPLSEEIEEASANMLDFGNSFAEVSSKAGDLEYAQAHIHDVWFEIGLIREKMDAGTMSVEEGTKRLNELFSELASNSKESFDALEKEIITAFGANSPITAAFEALGIDTTNLKTTIIQSSDTIQQKIKELTEQIQNTDPSDPNYETYMNQLMSLTGEYDDVQKQTEKLRLYMESHPLDWTEYLDVDTGKIDTDALLRDLEGYANAMDTAHEEIDSAGADLAASLQSQIDKLVLIGDSESLAKAANLQVALDNLPNALESCHKQVDEQGKQLTDSIQEQLLHALPTAIDTASAELDSKMQSQNFGERLIGYLTPKSNTFLKVVSEWKTSVQSLSKGIGDMFGTDFVLDDSVSEDVAHKVFTVCEEASVSAGEDLKHQFTQDVQNAITEGLAAVDVDSATTPIDRIYSHTSETVDSNKNKIKTSNAEISESINSVGDNAEQPMKIVANSYNNAATSVNSSQKSIDSSNKDIVNSTTNAVTESSSQMNEFIKKSDETAKAVSEAGAQTGKGWQDAVVEGIASGAREAQARFEGWVRGILEFFGISSPSRLMHDIGDDTIQGFVDGTEDNWNANESSVMSIFSGIIEDAKELLKPSDLWKVGADAIQGFHDGIVETWDRLKDRVSTIWDNISAGAKRAFNEHSPSKVFYQIGQYVIEGLELGIDAGTDDVENKFTSMASNMSEETLSIFTAMTDKIEAIMSRIEKLASLDSISKQLNDISSMKVPDIVVGSKLPDNPKFSVNANTDVDKIVKAVQNSSEEELQLLREQNNLLMGILEKQFSISGSSVFSAVRAENNNFIRKHGRSAFEY